MLVPTGSAIVLLYKLVFFVEMELLLLVFIFVFVSVFVFVFVFVFVLFGRTSVFRLLLHVALALDVRVVVSLLLKTRDEVGEAYVVVAFP